MGLICVSNLLDNAAFVFARGGDVVAQQPGFKEGNGFRD